MRCTDHKRVTGLVKRAVQVVERRRQVGLALPSRAESPRRPALREPEVARTLEVATVVRERCRRPVPTRLRGSGVRR